MNYQSQFAIQLKTKSHMQLPTYNVNFLPICIYKEFNVPSLKRLLLFPFQVTPQKDTECGK